MIKTTRNAKKTLVSGRKILIAVSTTIKLGKSISKTPFFGACENLVKSGWMILFLEGYAPSVQEVDSSKIQS